MNSKNNINSSNKFKESLSNVKEFILSLIRKKKERIEKETKNRVEEVIPQDENKEASMKDDSHTPKNSWNQDSNTPKQEQHFQDEDEYIPKDSEFWESMWASPRFAEIHPHYKWYYVSGRNSYFDSNTNLWAKKKQLWDINDSIDKTQRKYTYAWVMPAGLVTIPLPNGSIPDISSIVYNGKYPPLFKKDQNNCIYIQCQEKQYVSFIFYQNQNITPLDPIKEDSEKIIFDKLSSETQNLLNSLKPVSSKDTATQIKKHIISTKKYSTTKQWSLHKKSNKRNYITNLDASPVLDCFSAASLFAGLCRQLWIPCRVVTGHMSQETDGWKSLLGSNNGHAWNEFWDEDTQKWIHIDATPQVKEESDNTWNSQDNNNSESVSEQWDNSSKENESLEPGESSDSWNSEWDKGELSEPLQEAKWQEWESSSQEWNDSQWQESEAPSKSPIEALEELIEQAREDSLSKQAEELKDTIEKLEQSESKEDIKNILDNTKLSDFAKDMIQDIWNSKILDQEKKEIENATDESEIEMLEKNSLLNEDYKKKLSEYADVVRKKIEEEKKRQKSKMERMGFKDNELHLFQTYQDLEKEIEPELRSQIKALERILPKKYHTIQDKQNYHRSGPRIGSTGKLIEHTLTWDPNVFRRDKQVRESNEINMFESIIIDRSGSMGNFHDLNSPIRESVKAAIIRAKVLEHFKVEFNILFFDDNIEEVMAFGEVFTDKRLNTVPSRLMRALQNSWGTDIGQPLAYTLWKLEDYKKKTKKQSFWNISFIGDGTPISGLKWEWLKSLINEIRNKWYGLTAYYIGWSNQDKTELEWYFWNEQKGWTIIVPDIWQLKQKLIWSYNTGLRNIIRKYTK